MELISVKEAPKEFKVALLKALNYNVDKNGFVIDSNGKRVIDKYVDRAVRLENMAIFPGSTIVMDDNPLSIASYIEEHGEIA
ncbi:MAG: hypothetical protein HYU39_04585 [Thaumarchaeota archaeon]|nr:hypothetical protein [Nitrososphaerota archaeon]